jgi:hypothetical protein
MTRWGRPRRCPILCPAETLSDIVGLALSPALPSPTAVAIRDALGLVRLLYAGRRTRQAAPPPEADPLVAIGCELSAALELARYEEGSLGHRAALDRASLALTRLTRELTLGDSAVRLARVAQARVTGGQPTGRR